MMDLELFKNNLVGGHLHSTEPSLESGKRLDKCNCRFVTFSVTVHVSFKTDLTPASDSNTHCHCVVILQPPSGNCGNLDLAQWHSWSHHNIILSWQQLITNYMHTVELRWYCKLDITLILQYEMIKIWQGDCSYLWSGYEVHSGITAFMSDVGHFTDI